MKINNKVGIIAASVITAGLIAGAAGMASAAVQTNGSDGPLFAYDTNGNLITSSSVVLGWADDNAGSASATDMNAMIQCDPSSTSVRTFIATAGNERTVSAWSASTNSAFSDGVNHQVLLPTLTPNSFTAGNFAAVKAAGGDYSLGMACLNNGGLTVVGAYYRTVHITAGTGAYTMDVLADVVNTPTPTPTPVPTGTQGSVTLAPTTTGATNGVLSLTVPTNAAAVFTAPTLVNNKSTTLGALGAVTVADGRVVTRQGWDVTASVADFVNGSDTISKSQLGVAPAITNTEATGVTVGAAQVAGTSTGSFTFASGAAANKVGSTVLGAALTFVAPQEKAAGTYTSTMTLTVVSK